MEPERISDRVFYVKSRQGKVVRIVREQYLRTDMQDEIKKLDFEKEDLHVIFDTEITRDFLELLELPDIKNIIFPQTITAEIKDSSFAHYNRIRKITKDVRRNALVFCNESWKETHVDFIENESIRDRNDRAILNFIDWLIKTQKMKILFITNSESFHEKCSKRNIFFSNLKTFIEKHYFENKIIVDLFDSLELVLNQKFENITKDICDETTGFTNHQPEDMIELGIKSGKYLRGQLSVGNKHTEAMVKIKNNPNIEQIFLSSLIHQNRAIHGDTVAVEIVGQQNAIPEVVAVEIVVQQNGMPTGKVVGIIESRNRPYVCTLQLEDQSQTNQRSSVVVVPWDRRIPRIRMRTKQAGSLLNKRIVVRIDEWPIDSNYPLGHYVKQLGDIGLRDTEMSVLMTEYEISADPFTPQMLKELPGPDWKLPEHELKTRYDIRNWDIMSIDPKGSQDIDDALSVEMLPNGNVRLGVRILS